ncbi:MAG: YjgP/YjgQ family permease [Calditrichaeota bacterium]|nr:YjgP/YjgQ family permease [Calditrichota bacterium]
MNILTRYIIKEHIGPFFFSLSVIMFVFITKFIVQYIGKIFGKGLPISTIIEFVYLNLAWMLALAVPMAVLVASLMAFGRLAADNEIIILKTSGINLYRSIRPALLAAVVLTLIMTWYNDRVLPEFNHRARLLYQSISRKKPTLQLEEGIYLAMNNFQILVQDIERSIGKRLVDKSNILGPEFSDYSQLDKLRQITIFELAERNLQRTVIADYGYLYFDKKRALLVFTLFDGEIHEIDTRKFSEYRRLTFTRNVIHIPAPELIFKRSEDSWRGDREMTIAMMRERIREYRKSIEKEIQIIQEYKDNYLPAPQTLQLDTHSSDRPLPPGMKRKLRYGISIAQSKTQGTRQQIISHTNNIDFFKKQIYKYQVEIHKKFSIPFASIVFILIGAPLGIRARKGSLGIGMTFSIGFFLLYWVCLIGGEELADRKLLSPFLAMWLPNILVGLAGIYLTYKTVKETTFIQWERLPKALQLFLKGEEETTP